MFGQMLQSSTHAEQGNQHTHTQFITYPSGIGAQSTSELGQDIIPDSPGFVESPELFFLRGGYH